MQAKLFQWLDQNEKQLSQRVQMNMQQTEVTFLKCGKLLVTKLHLVLVLHLVGCHDKEQQIPWIRNRLWWNNPILLALLY